MRQIYSKEKLFVSNWVWFETAESVKIGYDNFFVNANQVKLSRTGKYPCVAQKQMTLILDISMWNTVGRANKYLHWNDWLLLKEMGVKEYDWCRIASYDEPNGIDRFKMSFGGRYNEDYNLYAACSLRAKV